MLDALIAYIHVVLNSLKADKAAGIDFGPRRDFVNAMLKRFNDDVVRENSPDNSDTAYVVGKGEEMAICLRNRKTLQLIDIEVLRFVCLHELSHIGCKEAGHPELFWKEFAYLLHYTANRGLYKPVDYSKYPVDYCGLKLISSPYYTEQLVRGIDFTYI